MNITIFSIMMGVLYFCVGTLILFSLRKKAWFIKIYGVNLLIVLAVGCLIRIVFPVELAITFTIRSKFFYPKIMRILKVPILEFKQGIAMWNLGAILFLVSITISFIIFIFHIRDYLKIYKCIAGLKSEVSELVAKTYDKVGRQLGIKKLPRIIQNQEISDPKIMGFYKPIIFIPKKNYSELELYYMILHEMIHYKKKDIWVKFIVNMICILLWWNPFSYLLKKDLNQLLEIRCDFEVCKGLGKEEIIVYLNTIIKILETSLPSYDQLAYSYYSSELVDKYKNGQFLEQRFRIVLMDQGQQNYKRGKMLVYFAFISLLIISYMYVIQPYSLPDESQYTNPGNDDVVIINAENSYIILEGNTGMLYINNVFEFVIQESDMDDLLMMGVPIY